MLGWPSGAAVWTGGRRVATGEFSPPADVCIMYSVGGGGARRVS